MDLFISLRSHHQMGCIVGPTVGSKVRSHLNEIIILIIFYFEAVIIKSRLNNWIYIYIYIWATPDLHHTFSISPLVIGCNPDSPHSLKREISYMSFNGTPFAFK